MRERICDLAARIIAEDGINDYALAKRKAARQLGATDTRYLPDNQEIEAALRLRLALYEPVQHAAQLRALREEALRLMRVFAQFRPRLLGSVLHGSATQFAVIELMVFCDDLNEILFFLMQGNWRYKLSERRFKSAVGNVTLPIVNLLENTPEVQIIVAAIATPGSRLRALDGKEIASADAAQVLALLHSQERD